MLDRVLVGLAGFFTGYGGCHGYRIDLDYWIRILDSDHWICYTKKHSVEPLKNSA